MPDHDLDIQILRLDPDLPPPSYAHPGDAGADLVTTVDVTLAPGERGMVPTGIALALPEGYVGLVHPRSGLAARSGLSIVNAPGTIDAGYRGEITVMLVNLDPTTPVVLRRGDRIAQLVVQRVERARFVEVAELPESVRGAGGLRFYRRIRPRLSRSEGDVSEVRSQVHPHPRGSPRRCRGGRRRRRGDATAPREAGPFDVDDLGDDGVERVDLGSMLIAPVAGSELRIQVDERSQQVQSVVMAGAEGALELRAFSAPGVVTCGARSARSSRPTWPAAAEPPPSRTAASDPSWCAR